MATMISSAFTRHHGPGLHLDRYFREAGRADSLPLPTGRRLAATVELLASNPLFGRCSREEIEFLAATAYPTSFEAGDRLCEEGGPSPECYVVAQGHAVVTIGRREVATVDEHDVVGERGILLNTVRAATVTATEPLIAVAICGDYLRAVVLDRRLLREWMLGEVQRHYPAAH